MSADSKEHRSPLRDEVLGDMEARFSEVLRRHLTPTGSSRIGRYPFCFAPQDSELQFPAQKGEPLLEPRAAASASDALSVACGLSGSVAGVLALALAKGEAMDLHTTRLAQFAAEAAEALVGSVVIAPSKPDDAPQASQ